MRAAHNLPPPPTGVRVPAGYNFMGLPVWRGEFTGITAAPGKFQPLYTDDRVLAVIAAYGNVTTQDGLMRPYQYKCHDGTGGGQDADFAGMGTVGYLSALTLGVGSLLPEVLLLYTDYREDQLLQWNVDNGRVYDLSPRSIYLLTSGGNGSPTFGPNYNNVVYKLQVDWIEGNTLPSFG